MADIKRSVNESPSFSLVTKLEEKKRLIAELLKMKPKVEVSLEGCGEIASARITDWDPARKFFTVQWNKKSEAFDEQLESDSALRTFFKVTLFSKVLVFKSATVRRNADGTYHYRIPEQFYQQHRRSALRVPLDQKYHAFLSTPIGEFEILDLSIGGARVKMPSTLKRSLSLGATYAPVNFSIPNFQGIEGFYFTVKITNVANASAGCKFLEMKKPHKAMIKQFLIDALHLYYEKNFKAKTVDSPSVKNEGMKQNPGGKPDTKK